MDILSYIAAQHVTVYLNDLSVQIKIVVSHLNVTAPTPFRKIVAICTVFVMSLEEEDSQALADVVEAMSLQRAKSVSGSRHGRKWSWEQRMTFKEE